MLYRCWLQKFFQWFPGYVHLGKISQLVEFILSKRSPGPSGLISAKIKRNSFQYCCLQRTDQNDTCKLLFSTICLEHLLEQSTCTKHGHTAYDDIWYHCSCAHFVFILIESYLYVSIYDLLLVNSYMYLHIHYVVFVWSYFYISYLFICPACFPVHLSPCCWSFGCHDRPNHRKAKVHRSQSGSEVWF